MAVEIYWLDMAVDRLHDIYSYYALKAGERIAKKLVNGIVDATLLLGDQPKVGQLEETLEDRPEGFRYLVHKNHKIIYWINEDYKRVEIAHVFDTRQNPSKIKDIK